MRWSLNCSKSSRISWYTKFIIFLNTEPVASLYPEPVPLVNQCYKVRTKYFTYFSLSYVSPTFPRHFRFSNQNFLYLHFASSRCIMHILPLSQSHLPCFRYSNDNAEQCILWMPFSFCSFSNTPHLFCSYNKSQQDCTISQLCFGKELYMFRPDLLSVIRSLNTVLKAIGICHASYVDCVLADLARRQYD